MGLKQHKVSGPIYDARELGYPRMLVLGFQFMCAMFAGNVLVAVLVGLDVATTLFAAGIGTLLFHFITKFKVPVFLGSSFAFMAAYSIVAPNGEHELLVYACFGMVIAGLVYVVVGQIMRVFGVAKVMRLFPPVVTGPIILCIGGGMAASTITMAAENWLLAAVGAVVVVICSVFGKNMVKIMPVLIGLIVSYLLAIPLGAVDFTPVKEAAWFGFPIIYEHTVFSIFRAPDYALMLSATLTILPLCLAALVEHVGDIVAVGNTCKKNFVKDPGLHRTLAGDGLATSLASLIGGPSNTTFTEGTACLSLTQVYDPRIVRIAAIIMALLGCCPKLAAIVNCIPQGTLGGVSIVMYATLATVGLRSIVNGKVDFDKSRNVMIVGIIIIVTVGVRYGLPNGIVIPVGGTSFSLSGMAVGAILGILLNVILPGRDEDVNFDLTEEIVEDLSEN